MRKTILILVCFPLSIFCQNTIGFPEVLNYSKQSYSAGLQNWDIKQDKNEIIYIANNEGLLSFDGRYWNLYPLPNKTIVRSVEVGVDNRIYVGGQDELGYFTPAPNGVLQYHSLTELIPAKDRSFGDVWDIVTFNKNIFFRSTNKIFRLTDGQMTTYFAPSEWSYLGLCNGQLYAHDYQTGIMQLENEVMKPVFAKNVLTKNDPVTGIMSIQKDSAIISTLKNGLYLFAESGISKLPSSSNQVFESNRIYASIAINADWLALATNNNGIYIIDHKGNIIQNFSKTEGLQNNNVLCIFLDNQDNLWLGLDDGIDLIAYNSAIKQINPNSQDGAGYAAIINDKHLYLGTSNGLYSVLLQELNDLSYSKGNFVPVNNTKGQIWNLSEINNQVLLGHHEGAFVIKNNTAIPISLRPGAWNFSPLSTTLPSAQIISGVYNGINIFDYSNGNISFKQEIKGFNESSRFVAIDKDAAIWVSHPYHGVYKIIKNKDDSYTTSAYTDKNGLPALLNNHVYKIKNEVVFATEKGIYNYNQDKDRFEPSPFYQKLFGNQSIRYLKVDFSGNIWFIHEKTLGVADFSGKEPTIIYLPELSNKMLSGFEFIYPVNENNIFLGGEKRFFHINYEKYKKITRNLQVRIRTVRIISKTDSLLYGGYFTDVNEKQVQEKNAFPEIANKWKTIRFEFASSLFAYESNLMYSFRLKGFDQNWSEWTKRTEKEYTNLPEGKYTFEVKVRNNLGIESATATYSFNLLPPWYRSTWSILIYFLLIIAGVYFIYKWQTKKFEQQKLKHEEEQNRLLYIHDLELSKTEAELIALRNAKLEAEINFKNSELATSAMHLVKKGELITKIKGDLSQVIKGAESPHSSTDLKKMIKTLSEDDNMDKEWEQFAKHFDKVHSDFLGELKIKHPAITPNELKLSAYLRMNLSTKEIAQLMNISVRGVEISRYRLRKKLQIPTEKTLFDYLIGIKASQ